MSEFRLFDAEASYNNKTVGQILTEARIASGLDHRDLGAVTKIQPTLLRYLEEDRFEEFSAEVFARGFLRNYARELRLDEDLIMEIYLQQTGQRPRTLKDSLEVVAQPAPESTERSDGKFADRSTFGRVAYAAGLALVVLALALSVLVFGGTPNNETSASNLDLDTVEGGETWAPVPEGQNDWRTVREN